MYAKGQGAPQNYAEALKWFRLAANQGDADAQYNLGLMYARSRGVPLDYAEAMQWFQKAAAQDNATAQFSLGAMYANGQGVPRDHVRAQMWLNLAAARGYQEAIKYRDIIAQRMTPGQLAEAEKLAREWKPKSER